MKLKTLVIILLSIFCLESCLVNSFYPLHSEDTEITDFDLSGDWIDEDESVWHLSASEKGGYTLTLDSSSAKFEVHLLKLNDDYFLDFVISKFDGDMDENADVIFTYSHLAPTHSFAKVILDSDHMNIKWISGKWVKEMKERGNLDIDFVSKENYILLTAKTEELQEFVMKHAKNPDAFNNGLITELNRLK